MSHWFQAKRYGIGWGLPVTWQGWAALVAFVAALLFGIPLIDDARLRILYAAGVTLLFVCVVALKGERPLEWRRGRHRQ